MTCGDFRGNEISPILSQAFEHCFLNRFKSLLLSDNNQFGFKKGVCCNHAIYTASQVINKCISGGNTANLCAIDLSGACDKVNHHALYIKLVKRHVPAKVLDLLEKLMSYCYSCIKWKNIFSEAFAINFGARRDLYCHHSCSWYT